MSPLRRDFLKGVGGALGSVTALATLPAASSVAAADAAPERTRVRSLRPAGVYMFESPSEAFPVLISEAFPADADPYAVVQGYRLDPRDGAFYATGFLRESAEIPPSGPSVWGAYWRAAWLIGAPGVAPAELQAARVRLGDGRQGTALLAWGGPPAEDGWEAVWVRRGRAEVEMVCEDGQRFVFAADGVREG